MLLPSSFALYIPFKVLLFCKDCSYTESRSMTTTSFSTTAQSSILVNLSYELFVLFLENSIEFSRAFLVFSEISPLYTTN